MLARVSLRNNLTMFLVRKLSGESSQGLSTTTSSAPPPAAVGEQEINVPGLSSACVHPATEPLGPGVDPNKSGAYKVPEYFCYDNMSYFEAEIEMSKFRCPQPSALKKDV